MKKLAFLAVLPLLFACKPDETLTGHGAADRVWVLQSMDGVLTSARVTLRFPETGRLAGQAPCNIYGGRQSAPYPWFRAEDLAVTRMACPDMAVESAYFSALSDMTLSEVSGDILVLSNDAGREMLFRASPD